MIVSVHVEMSAFCLDDLSRWADHSGKLFTCLECSRTASTISAINKKRCRSKNGKHSFVDKDGNHPYHSEIPGSWGKAKGTKWRVGLLEQKQVWGWPTKRSKSKVQSQVSEITAPQSVKSRHLRQ